MQGTVSRGKAIHITGIVQGVGFRPFVYNLALRHHLSGWVRNTSQGVDIRVEGCQAQLEAFVAALASDAPRLSHIDSLTATDCHSETFEGFEIRYSERIEGAFQPIHRTSPCVMTVSASCLTRADRRFHYPFINCTNCGPRFTIVENHSLRQAADIHEGLSDVRGLRPWNTTTRATEDFTRNQTHVPIAGRRYFIAQ